MITSNHRHWLFWPLIFFTFQIIIYLFFFSSKGYLAYQKLYEKKFKLSEWIKNLEDNKKKFSKRRDMMLDDKKAYQKFKEELLLAKDKEIEIIKFDDTNQTIYSFPKKNYPLLYYQRTYIMIAGILQISFVGFFFYHQMHKPEQNDFS